MPPPRAEVGDHVVRFGSRLAEAMDCYEIALEAAGRRDARVLNNLGAAKQAQRDFEGADELRDVLTREHGVTVYDRDNLWFVGGGYSRGGGGYSG